MKKYLKLIEFSDKKSVWLLFFVHFIMAGFNVYVSFLLQKGISSAMSGKVSEVFDALCLMLVGVIIYILTYYWSACIQEKGQDDAQHGNRGQNRRRHVWHGFQGQNERKRFEHDKQ